MHSFPMFIRTTGRRVVIVGGGETAAQKARLVLKTDADILLVAPKLDDELANLVAKGRADWDQGTITPALFEGAAMCFVGTDCPGLDASIHAIAKAANCPVNVVDQPHLCDITTPSIVDRDPVVVAIRTEGTAPVLARQIKSRVEEILPPNMGGLAAFAGRMRQSVARQVPKAKRRAFWRWVFADAPREAWTRGAERDAARLIKDAIRTGHAPEQKSGGSVTLVGAGPGARDLLTLRAVQRLQEADIIFYDRLIEEDVLELARRDAERVFVGKVVGAHAWPQERINELIVAEAAKGKNVVRLKSGDPGVFGRAAEEIEAAETAGIPVEIVPGVTAVCAAAATMRSPLTERGKVDTLVLTTGEGRADDPAPESARLAAPGTTTAIYMGTRHAARLEKALDQGVPANSPIRIAVSVTKPDERFIEGTLSELSTLVQEHNVKGCAILMITWPEERAARASVTPFTRRRVAAV